jgi:Tol biopolymer transport system component
MCSIRRALALGLVLAALFVAPSARPEGQNKIMYDTFEWSIYESTHFDVYYYPRGKDALQKVVSMAESAYDELSRRLNYQIPKKIPLIYYVTHAEFEQNNIILNFIPEGVGAFAEPARNRMVLPIDVPDEKLQALIQHELTHIFQYEILFGGRLGRALTSNAPTWFMEGMASYFGNDEDEKDRMFVRDAVNSDVIPPITRVQIQGYPAYRFGHAFFDFLEAEWGRDAPRDFVYEFRSFLSNNLSQALRRTFDVTPEDFDLKFRRYLRRKYLPLLAQKGEVSEYGQVFRTRAYESSSYEIGTAASPSGDFVAALTTDKDAVDIALFSAKERKLYKNLSAGRTTKYEYIVGQYLTTGPASGRDLSFAPDGDTIAVFGRHGRGRELLLFSVRSGGLLTRIQVAPDQPLAPAFSPDGQFIAFAATAGNHRDIYLLDLKTTSVRNLSDDVAYDEAPVFSPDGTYIYHQKIVQGLAKIVRFPLADPTAVEEVTWGEGNDEDPTLSPDGKRLYFASSRGGGIFNIYSQDLATGELLQFTDVIGAALGPSSYIGPDGQEKVVFYGYQAQRFQLYVADGKKPVRKLDERALPPSPLKPSAVAEFSPALEVSIDPEKVSRPKKFRLFLSDVGGYLGIDSSQQFVSSVQLDFSDYLGNQRGIFVFDSIASFTNFNLGYYNLKKRLQWGVNVYDQRQFIYGFDPQTGTDVRGQQISRYTGVTLSATYPFSRYTRVEGQVGFLSRTIPVPALYFDPLFGFYTGYTSRNDDVPTVGLGFSYDTVQYKSFGPYAGSGVDVQGSYLPDLKDGGLLAFNTFAQLRQYVPLTRRMSLAVRGAGLFSTGNVPNIYNVAGIDTLRSVPYGSLYGNNVFWVNVELRFPLVDVIALPFMTIGGIRGRAYFDLGGAWFDGQSFSFNDRLGVPQNGAAEYGVGFSIYLLGLPLNFDFVQQWNFHHNIGPSRFIFTIGFPTF